jgi:signal transduction histidine kinase
MNERAPLDEILGTIDLGYVTVDRGGIVTALSARAAEVLGVDPASALGRPVAEVALLLGPDGTPLLSGDESALQRALRDGEQWRGPLSGVPVQSADAAAAVSVQIAPLQEGAVLVVGDAAPLRELLDANDALISITSHELKTPLTAIKAMSELMLSYELDAEQRKEMIGDIFQQAERLEQLIREILDASQIDSGRVTLDVGSVDLRDILAEVLDELQTQLDGRNLKVSFPKRLPQVRADAAKLRQVLVNLITNAIKYSPEAAPVEVKAAAGPDAVRVDVRDHGIGIRREDLSRLFKKFQRIRDPATHNTAGTGLGLYIVKGLVELQGGAVEVASEYGSGSTFSFTLPLAEAAQP